MDSTPGSLTVADAPGTLVADDGTVVELVHGDGSLSRLDAGASAVIERPGAGDDERPVLVRLGAGRSLHRSPPGVSYRLAAPAADIEIRGGTLLAEVHGDGSCTLVAVDGVPELRVPAGDVVRLQSGQVVRLDPSGAPGPVVDAGEQLHRDEWMAVNEALDADGSVPAGTTGADGASAAPPAERAPWRVGTAAAVALAVALVSVALGRGGEQQPASRTARADEPRIAVPGPPAFAAPAVATPRPSVALTDRPPRRLLERADQAPVIRPAPEVPALGEGDGSVPEESVAQPAHGEVTSTACARRPAGVSYAGTLTNAGGSPARFEVEVGLLDAGDRVIAAETLTTALVPAGESVQLSAVLGGPSTASAARHCEVLRVAALS